MQMLPSFEILNIRPLLMGSFCILSRLIRRIWLKIDARMGLRVGISGLAPMVCWLTADASLELLYPNMT